MAKILSYNSPAEIEKESTKQNIFQKALVDFQSLDKFTKFMFLTILLIAVGTPIITTQYLSLNQHAAGITATPPTPTAMCYQGIISGIVWNDVNKNSVLDVGEGLLPNQIVTLTGASSAMLTTNSQGKYTFSSLPPGTYTVTVTVPQGYASTTPNPVTTSMPTCAATTVINYGLAYIGITPTPVAIPYVRIASPTNGSKVLGSMSVNVEVTDNVNVTKVTLLIDYIPVATQSGVVGTGTRTYAFTQNTKTLSNGKHIMWATASDTVGRTQGSGFISIYVSNLVGPTRTPY